MLYSIWMEGFATIESNGHAMHLGDYEASSFSEACQLAANDYPNYGYYNSHTNCIWGCRLFDNEIDARRSFG